MIKAGVDWGSSGFRAYRFDRSGEVVEAIESDLGIKFSKSRGFEETLFETLGHWLDTGDQVLLCGMICSKDGWVESPYMNCPAVLDQLVTKAKKISVRGIECTFLPGVSSNDPPNIMRGEETQLLGTKSAHKNYLAIVPGTHSKWVRISEQTIVEFATIATGEIFEVLLNHSLIGKLCDDSRWNETVFLKAVKLGFNSKTITSDLFVCRSGVLLKQLTSTDAYTHLSGLLIGNEIREGLQLSSSIHLPIVLIGNPKLCQKYQSALSHLNLTASIEPPDSAARGFQTFTQKVKDAI